MQVTDTVQRVRIYLNEDDEVSGRPLYLATMEMLREAGATGATAMRGVAGFGASQRMRIVSADSSRAAPIIVEWVDRAERVARVLPALDALLPMALITIETIQVYRAILRSGGPFGERTVGELLARTVITADIAGTLSDAVRVLIESGQHTLPVVDLDGRLAGTLRAADLRRFGMPTLAYLRAESEQERAAQLASFALTPLETAITTEVLALSGDASVLQAANTMVEWGSDELPILERDGRLMGLFNIDHALVAALAARTAGEGSIRNADAPMAIGVLMQAARPVILGYDSAVDGVERLLVRDDGPLFVVDNNRPLGVLSRETLLAESSTLRPLLGGKPTHADLHSVLGELRVASLPLAPLPALPTSAGYDQAIALLRDQAADWLAAVDGQGKIEGLVGKRTILRALVQESARR